MIVIQKILKRCSALVAVSTLLQPAFMPVAMAQYAATVTAQPANTDALVTQYYINPTADPQLSYAQMTQLLRSKIKYVFVIFNENESFDHEYGTFPGANGLYYTWSANGPVARSPANTPGFTQTYTDTYSETTATVQPFLVGPAQNSTVMDSEDHGHTGLAKKLDVVNGVPQMDGFAQDEFYNGYPIAGGGTQAQEAKGRQRANVVMSHIDCNTIPFYWLYASRFTLFDNIFATEDTPSSPNAIAMIAGQSGETQWVKHGSAGMTAAISGTINGTNYNGQTSTTAGPPIVNDPQPYWGSEFDATTGASREPAGAKESYTATNNGSSNIASNLTFATVALTAMGTSINTILATDKAPSTDLADIQNDIPAIAAHGTAATAWRWYQNGYDLEPTDTGGVASHANFVSHHEGPQYFGYIANDTTEQANLKGEGDFFTDFTNNNLPANGGIIYIRGGYGNLQGLKTPIQNPNYPDTAGLTPTEITTIQTAKAGDDDHPSYSDHQIAEAMTARVINAIASNATLWAESAIIITYDESDGFYDHVPPRILSYGPDSLPLSRGIRVPLIVISPYSRVHVVSHAEGDHNSVIETINTIFNLPSLSSLPDEAAALTAGNSTTFNAYAPAGFQQKYLGPRDTNSATTDSLLSAFDPSRLRGLAPMLPASYATIPNITSLPHYNGAGCSAIGITPMVPSGQLSDNAPPANFNTLPSTLPAYNSPAP
jgi:phospholipase C